MTKFEAILEIEKSNLKIKELESKLLSEYKKKVNNLSYLRVLNDLTYEELAINCNYKSRQNVYKLLNDTSKIRNIEKIEKVLTFKN